MTIESQKAIDARYAELTELAKWNVCAKCDGNLEIVWSANWYLYCPGCRNTWSKYAIKHKPTLAEETAARIKKMEESARRPTNKYNIDELFGVAK